MQIFVIEIEHGPFIIAEEYTPALLVVILLW